MPELAPVIKIFFMAQQLHVPDYRSIYTIFDVVQ
jgi:hypothetical protein